MDISYNYKHLKQSYLAAKKKVIHKTQNAENTPSLEVVLCQWSLVDNQHRQKSEVLYTFMPNKSYE